MSGASPAERRSEGQAGELAEHKGASREQGLRQGFTRQLCACTCQCRVPGFIVWPALERSDRAAIRRLAYRREGRMNRSYFVAGAHLEEANLDDCYCRRPPDVTLALAQ